MKIFVLISTICVVCSAQVECQTSIDMQDVSMRIINYNIYSPAIKHTEDISNEDNSDVEVFKSYFNCQSLANFRSHFLPGEWNPVTTDAFIAWQSKLKDNPLYLNMTIEVEDNFKNRFLILRYTMVTPHIDYYQSKVLKWYDGKWMHRNIDDKFETIYFETIGNVDNSLLKSSLEAKKSSISLNNLTPDMVKTHKEKYSIEEMLAKVKDVLLKLNVNINDIDEALNLFSYKDALGMIDFVSEKYRIPSGDLMGAINASVGFKFYQFDYTNNLPSK